MSDLDIRVGHLGTDVFLSSDYRNVSYASPWMRPTHEFYGTIPIYHYDGFDITKRYTINSGYLTPYLTSKQTNMHFMSIGGTYDDGIWLAQTEVAYLHTDTPLFPSLTSAYFSLGRRISSVTLYTLFGITHTFDNNIDAPNPVSPTPDIQDIQDSVDIFLNQNGINQKSISLGVRWAVYSNIALKAQWSHFWLGDNGAQLWQKFDTEQTPRQVNVWSFGFDFIF